MKRRPVIVAVSGAFDPIHVGHVRYIRDAAKLGDKLIVILNSDNFLRRKKGFVFMPFAERKEIVESIKGVDEVMASIDEDQTVNKTLEMLRPDIFAKGGGWAGLKHVPEAETCRAIGCKLITNVGGEIVHSDREMSDKFKGLGSEDSSHILITCPYCDNHPILKERCLSCGGTGKLDVGKRDEGKA